MISELIFDSLKFSQIFSSLLNKFNSNISILAEIKFEPLT